MACVRLTRLAAAALLVAAAPASAETIHFDELPPANNNTDTLSEEYAHLGAHFVTTDDGSIWSGLSDGDPGGWDLEGTNGSAFLGFNGSSYALTLWFDAAIPHFGLDVSRAAGSQAGNLFGVEGYRDGLLVETAAIALGAIDEWSSVELRESVDEVVWYGVGESTRRHPFGVDNLHWGGEAAMQPVAVDVRPGNPDNPLNPFARGIVPVALLGSEAFDVEAVDPATLAFGPGGAAPLFGHVRRADLDGDGRLDLIAHYRIWDTGIAVGDLEACLTGELSDGTAFEGCDAVWTVPRVWNPSPGRSRR